MIRLFGNRFDRAVTEVAKVPVSFGLAAIVAERILQVGRGRGGWMMGDKRKGGMDGGGIRGRGGMGRRQVKLINWAEDW